MVDKHTAPLKQFYLFLDCCPTISTFWEDCNTCQKLTMPFAFVNRSKRTWPYSGRKHDFTCFYFPVITGISLSTRPLEQKLTWLLVQVFNQIYIHTKNEINSFIKFKMHWNLKGFVLQFGLLFFASICEGWWVCLHSHPIPPQKKTKHNLGWLELFKKLSLSSALET